MNLKGIIPPGLNGVQRWRLTIGACVAIFWLFLAGSFGVYSYLGLWEGFAAASDTARLTTLGKQVQDNTENIGKLIEASKKQSEVVDDLLLLVIGQRIRAAVSARCRIPAERERINQEIELMQREYEKRAGSRYPEPPCSAL